MFFLVDKLPENCNKCLCADFKTYGIPNTKSFKQTYECRLTGQKQYIINDVTQRFDRCPLKEYKPPPINNELIDNLTKIFNFKGGENH